MDTYSTNDEILFHTGRSLDEYFAVGLTNPEIELLKDTVRERSYYFINGYIQGKTAIPSILPQMKMIEIDLCIYEILTDSYSGQEANISEYPEKYKENAIAMLDALQFGASNSLPESKNTNVGNGVLTILSLNESYLKSEMFEIRAQSATKFSVIGSSSQYIGQATLAEIFPEHNSSSLIGVFSDYGAQSSSPRCIPFSFIIEMPIIDPIPFLAGDIFTFMAYAGKDSIHTTSGQLIRA